MGVHFRYQQIFLPHWLVEEEKSKGGETLGASPFASAFYEAIIILSRHAARRLLRTRLLLVLLLVFQFFSLDDAAAAILRCCRRPVTSEQ